MYDLVWIIPEPIFDITVEEITNVLLFVSF